MVLVMSIVVDTRTVFLTLLIGYFIAMALTLAYWNGSMRLPSLQVYIGAKSAQAVALFLLALRGYIPGALSILLANSMLFVVYALEICVLLHLQGMLTTRMKRLYAGLTLGGIIGFLLIYMFANQEEYRIAFVSAQLAFMFLPAYRLMIARHASLLARVMGALYLFLGIYLLIRADAAVFGYDWASYYRPGEFQLLILIVLFLVVVVSHTGFVLLFKEQANRELVRLANQDDLTGALNRRTFAILTARVRRYLGADDLLVRYGGDEFGILLPG
jgi:hypothetical protein